MEHSDAKRNAEGWEEIRGFQSPGEFRRFERWIDEAIDQGALVEVPVGDRYSGASVFDERWFEARSGQMWRLVSPDPPFAGVFAMIEENV